jgi:single-strand DNA-binding protein
MSNETTTTVVGNVTADPELRETGSGVPVATFTVASTSRVRDGQSGEWRDGETLFLRCSAWRRTAENVAGRIRKGDRVVVTGRLRQRTFETDAGQRRSTIELMADEVALSLRSTGAQPVGSGSGDTDEPADLVATGVGTAFAR